MPNPLDSLDDGTALVALMRRFYPLIVEQSFLDADAVLDAGLLFELANPAVQAVLDQLATEVKRVAETTRDEIRDLVGRQAAEGWSTEDLAREIEQLAEVHSRTRARAIARTESAAAYSKGSIAAYRESGVVASVEWLATMDEATSEGCRALHGTQAKLGDAFADGTLHPPRHPLCRCALTPVLRS